MLVKFHYGSDIRRVTVDKRFTWDDACTYVKGLFEITGKISLKYKDEEGDTITVSSDRELADAFEILNGQTIHFTICAASTNDTGVKCLSSNLNELVLDIDVGNMLPSIQNVLETLAPQVMKEVKANFPELAVHHGITCDGCQASPIQGNRWKCNVCPDYDLCDKCNTAGTHKEHAFTKIERSRWNRCPRFRGAHGGRRHCEKKEEQKVEVPKKAEESKPVEIKVEQPKVEEPKVELKKEEPKAVEQPKVEAPKKVEEPKVELKKEEPKAVEQPKVEEPKKVEAPKKPEQQFSPDVADKLKQLEAMGFMDASRNIMLITLHNGDLVKVVMDLLAL